MTDEGDELVCWPRDGGDPPCACSGTWDECACRLPHPLRSLRVCLDCGAELVEPYTV